MKNQNSSTMNLLKKSLLAAVIMAFAIMPAMMSAQSCTGGIGANKVLNGGFQAGGLGTAIPNWSVAWPSSVDSYLQVTSGGQGGSSQALLMGSVPGENRISQTISGLTAGSKYVLCFWLKGGASNSPSSFEATWNDKNVFQIINTTSSPGYTYYSFQVEAVGGGYDLLSFEERNSPSYFYLDNIAVQVCSTCSIGTFDQEGPTKALPPGDSE